MERAKVDNYRSERGAAAYLDDHRNKVHRRWSDRIERRILVDYLAPYRGSRTILDIPSGFGRFANLLRGYASTVIEADMSETMLALNWTTNPEKGVAHRLCSALAIPFRDRSVDIIVSVRLSHHFDRLADREAHLRELMRVADRAVIVTFFSHTSLKNTLRRLRTLVTSKGPKHTLQPSRVAELARESGFRLTRATPLSRLGSGHVYALLERQ